MSLYPLYPGNPRKVVEGQTEKYLLDEDALKDAAALQDSLALAMENEMIGVYKKVKGTDMPAEGREDLRLLFVAISRGILWYLDDRAKKNAILTLSIDHDPKDLIVHKATGTKFDIVMEK